MSTAIRTIGVAGCGTMGAGIAIVSARAGFETIMYDTEPSMLDRARDQISQFFGQSVQRGKLTEDEVTSVQLRLTSTAEIEALASCDLVIEAVFEDLAVKQKLFGSLDVICSAQTLFATNTSTLSVTEIASGCNRPRQVIGMHFCLPAQLMKLVEVTSGVLTDESVFNMVWELCGALGQEPVRTSDRPGFVLNYFVVPLNNDAIRLVEAGIAHPSEIDAAMKQGMGYAMGPCELLDLIGLDTQMRLCDAFHPVTNNPRHAAPPLLRRMVAAGQLGRKSGQGFYTYERDAMFGG